MITPVRVSYAVLAATIILAGVLHLGVPLLVVLFSYFALRQLYSLTRRKLLALTLFIIAVVGIGAAGVYFTRAAILALPDVADTSIPSASAWAQKRQIELPFSDFETLRQVVVGALGEEANYLRCDRDGRADHHFFHQYRVDCDLSHGGSHAARAAAYCGHLSLRARADCRQPSEQHNHRFCRVDGVPEVGDFRAGLSRRDPQARVFVEQQDHRGPDSQSGLAHVNRSDPWRTTYGDPRLNPRAGSTELFARGNADRGGAGSTRRSRSVESLNG